MIENKENELQEALDTILKAWNILGPAPEYHRHMQRKLRFDWPALANALDDASCMNKISTVDELKSLPRFTVISMEDSVAFMKAGPHLGKNWVGVGNKEWVTEEEIISYAYPDIKVISRGL